MPDYSYSLAFHLVLGAVFLFYFLQFVRGRRRLLAPASMPLLLFVLLYGVTILTSNPYLQKREWSNLAVLIFLLLLLPNFPRKLEAKRVKFYLRLLMRGTLAVSSPIAFFALACFTFKFHGKLILLGRVMLFGVIENRIWALFSPNFLAMLTFAAMWSSVALLLAEREKEGRIRPLYLVFYLSLLALNMAAFMLAQGRATILGFLVLVVLAIGFVIPIFQKLSRGKRIVLRMSIALVATFFLYSAMVAMGVSLRRLPRLVYEQILPQLRQSETYDPSRTNDPEANFIPPIEEEGAMNLFTNKKLEGHSWEARFILWDYGLRYFKQSPLVGKGIITVRQKAARDIPQAFRFRSFLGGGFHNSYVSILVYSGLLGFLCLATFFLFLLWKLYQFMMLEGRYFEKFTLLYIPAMLVREFLESCCLYILYYESLTFWFVVGAALYFLRAERLIRDSVFLSPKLAQCWKDTKQGMTKSLLELWSRVQSRKGVS